MHSLELHKTYTVEEYFAIEKKGEVRYEFINGNLIEMAGASREHHFICQNVFMTFLKMAKPKGYLTFIENMKVKIPDEDRYYYPDIFITKENQTEDNKYVQFQPELIVEVLSETTRVTDITDKFIQYRKLPSLSYYLLVEPEKTLVLFNYKKDDGNWEMQSFTETKEVISLSELGLEVRLDQIYGI